MSSVDDFNTGAGIDLNANAYEHQQRASRGQQLTEDYADKGLDQFESKEGPGFTSRGVEEKAAETAREGFGKVSG
ncbi:hypothetical protein GYMLUDRAFT_47594 [Collybiopsis luxurians FD-317 M1]|uniref:Unplaced genomic scaffold GYMLUscaffold_56, whole genome shotgun sequence n=1 Tax=Collybiopsis luxurians FD-317 M1 TaxID=944289 RepID=A0A0D0CKI9_9AGAR|nr:hypothetical protein GYMLUDRAFT_47594 [Collybiopsis luxurians FD-317 M1]